MSWTAGVMIGALVLATSAVFLGPGNAGASGGGASDVVAMVNSARAGQGLAALAEDGALAAIAQEHSARMRDAGTIYHNGSLGAEITSGGITWSAIGENVGEAANVGFVEDGFVHSPEHYRNIMDPRFTAIGVGVATADSGVVYVTQVFAAIGTVPRSQAAAAPAPADAPAVSPKNTDASTPAAPPARPVVSTVAPRPSVPAGFMRAEDGSVVPRVFYAHENCATAGWVGESARGDLISASSVGAATAC